MSKRKFDELTDTTEPPCKSRTIQTFFSGTSLYILPTAIGKPRCAVFEKQCGAYGANIVKDYSSLEGLLIIVDDKLELDRALRIIKTSCEKITCNSQKIVKSLWLSKCLNSKNLVDINDYEIKLPVPQKPAPEQSLLASTSPRVPSEILQDVTRDSGSETERTELKVKLETDIKHVDDKTKLKTVILPDSDDSDYCDSDGDVTSSSLERTAANNISTNLQRGGWVCAESSADCTKHKHNPNQHITDKLEKMIEIYQSTNDKWRVFGYQKAVAALKAHPTPISTWQEAKGLRGVGAKLADKIWEISESGELRKLEALSTSETNETLQLFKNVWGAGPVTAQQWYAQGLRSLEDLKDRGNLNKQQKVGLRLYYDLIERMPRAEATEIASEVESGCMHIDDGLISQACGSYRRGQPTCGDVDVLVTHPDGKSHLGVFHKLIDVLHQSGFLTDDLTLSQDGNLQKYLGVCKLKGEDRKHRRLDIIVVPYAEYACALLYFTGSAHFNRSLRLLAKKSGMSLNEHSLNVGVIRTGGEKVHRGTPISTPTEESIFKAFSLEYRPPEERNH